MRAGLLLLLLPLLASADTVALKGGKRFKGRVVTDGDEVVVNIYNSTLKKMTLGVHRFPKDKVKKITRTIPAPHREFQLRLMEIWKIQTSMAESIRQAEAMKDEMDGDADTSYLDEELGPKKQEALKLCTDLAAWCEEKKLKKERLYALAIALRFDPENAAIRKQLGSKAPAGDWLAQMAAARTYLEADDAAARGDALAKLRRFKGAQKDLYLRRAWRSARQPKGYQKDRPVALRADKLLDNARYTLFVPRTYDALAPTALVIGLHGGGAGGADGKLVVGSGWQAMNFYQNHCEQRGWICACPTALRAGWRNKPNNELIDAVLEELHALYNIDENRIYLVGHSMGGGGTWAQGSRLPETWAAIAPAASFGVTGISQFKKTKTGFYVYHSDNDPRTGVGGVRPSMLNLPGQGIDFVYTELPGRGHAFPGEVVRDIFRFFEARLLSRGPGRFKPQVRPLSSFHRKVSRDEKKYLPKLKAAAAGAEESTKKLLKQLTTGGGVAEAAVPKLVAHQDPKVSASVAKILLKGSSGPDVRRYAARILGGRKAADQLKALGRVLLIETESNALLEVLDAIGEINDPAAGDALLRFLKKRTEYLVKRTQGGILSHSDWETIVPTLARACKLVGSFKPEKGGAVLGSTVVNGVLLSSTGVRYDMQNQRPLPYARALGEHACAALGRLGGEDAVAALKRILKDAEGAQGTSIEKVYGPVGVMRHWARDPTVAAYAREALGNLRG